MKRLSPGRIILTFAASLFFLPFSLIAQQAVSHVRVVRLSYVSGTVTVKQPGATEWAKALVNTPIQEGFEISTLADSFAEVEFENGSTARLGELSKLAFDQLALDANGAKLNRVTFEQGYATFHFIPEKHDAYSVKVADATLTPNGKSMFRTDLDKGQVRVEVFNGSVQVIGPSGSAKLGKDKTLEYNAGTTQVASSIHPGTSKDSWDKWTEARDSQATLALNDQAVAPHGPAYGWSDLDAYGEWAMFPGFGYGWSPFASMGWSPYSMGMWNWFPGMGYTWISGEPWGWLPYHYGNWNFSPAFGWFWMPGNFGFWSPSLVSWFTGPGWVGWAPLGLNSRQGLIKPITTIRGKAIQTGQIITPEIVGHSEFSEKAFTTHPPFEAGKGVTMAGTALAVGAATSSSTNAGAAHTRAPSSILMGGEGDMESAMLGGRRLHEPFRVRLGTTLGGRYAVGGTVGEFRGDAFQEMSKMNRSQSSAYSRGNSQPRLNVLSHGQSAESSRASNSGQMLNSGTAGGFSNSASSGMSAPNSPHSTSSSSSSSSSAGHH